MQHVFITAYFVPGTRYKMLGSNLGTMLGSEDKANKIHKAS